MTRFYGFITVKVNIVLLHQERWCSKNYCISGNNHHYIVAPKFFFLKIVFITSNCLSCSSPVIIYCLRHIVLRICFSKVAAGLQPELVWVVVLLNLPPPVLTNSKCSTVQDCQKPLRLIKDQYVFSTDMRESFSPLS